MTNGKTIGCFLNNFLFIYFWLCHVLVTAYRIFTAVHGLCGCSTLTCGILVPQPGIEPAFPALEGGIYIYIRLLISTTLKDHPPFSQPAGDGESSKNTWENPAPFTPQVNLSCAASLLRIRSSYRITMPLQLRHGCRDSAISVCSKSNLFSLYFLLTLLLILQILAQIPFPSRDMTRLHPLQTGSGSLEGRSHGTLCFPVLGLTSCLITL